MLPCDVGHRITGNTYVGLCGWAKATCVHISAIGFTWNHYSKKSWLHLSWVWPRNRRNVNQLLDIWSPFLCLWGRSSSNVGLGFEIWATWTYRAMLGHHEETGQSMACSSRDLLARPLSQYQSMLMNVRRGFFLPDASRSASLSLRAQLEVLQKSIHRWRRLQDHRLQWRRRRRALWRRTKLHWQVHRGKILMKRVNPHLCRFSMTLPNCSLVIQRGWATECPWTDWRGQVRWRQWQWWLLFKLRLVFFQWFHQWGGVAYQDQWRWLCQAHLWTMLSTSQDQDAASSWENYWNAPIWEALQWQPCSFERRCIFSLASLHRLSWWSLDDSWAVGRGFWQSQSQRSSLVRGLKTGMPSFDMVEFSMSYSARDCISMVLSVSFRLSWVWLHTPYKSEECLMGMPQQVVILYAGFSNGCSNLGC